LLSSQTTKILAVFTAIATTAAFSAWMFGEEIGEGQEVSQNHVFKDEKGAEYTLTENEDGTETATYEDGSYVTFRREEDGSLKYIAGTAGLLAGLAAGYYAFHGLSGGGGYYNSRTQRYTSSTQVKPLPEREKDKLSHSSGNYRSSTHVSNSSGKSTAKSSTGAKSGFGSAGARSSAS
jgi:hypothetical protein